MERLPLELLLMVCKELRPKDWPALATVIPRVYRLTQPMVFQRVVVSSVHRGWHSAERFTGVVAARPALAGLVRALRIFSETAEDSRVRDPPLEMLASFSSLRHLHLVGAHLNTHVIDAIRSLPALRSLVCKNCGFDDTPNHMALSWKSELHHLTLDSPLTSQGWPALICPRLRSLDLFLGESMHWQRLPHTAEVTHLRIHPQTASLAALLLEFQHVRYLTLRDTYVGDLSALPYGTLPSLEVFSGNARYAALFITGRPVHTAKLYIEYRFPSLLDVLRALRDASVPVTTLELSGDPIRLNMLEHAPLTLRCFAFYCPKVTVAQDLRHFLRKLPDLQKLCVTGGACANQETLVPLIVAWCESVRKIECAIPLASGEGRRVCLWSRPDTDAEFQVVKWIEEEYPFYTKQDLPAPGSWP